jgi:membrane-associated protein
MHGLLNELFNIPHIINTYGYVGIFIIVFLESGIFFALPGDSLLFTAGLLASTFGLHLFVLIPVIFVATFLGGVTGYQIGFHLHSLHRFVFFRKMVKKEYVHKAHKFFEKHGMFAIVFSRFVPIVRTFTPIVAGIAQMDYAKFIKWSVVASFFWTTTVTLTGYFLGRAFPWIKDYLSVLVVLVVIVSLIPMMVRIYRSRKESNLNQHP